MSDQIVQGSHGSDQTVGPSLHPEEGVWMAHWMHTRSKPMTHGHNLFEQAHGLKGGDAKHVFSEPEERPKINDESPTCKTRFVGSGAMKAKIDVESPTTSSEHIRKGIFEKQPFPMNLLENKESALSLENREATACHREEPMSQIDPNSGYDAASRTRSETPFTSMFTQSPSESERMLNKNIFKHESILQSSEQQHTESGTFYRKNVSGFSTSFQDDLIGSTSKNVKFGSDSGKAPMHSTWSQGGLHQLTSGLVSKDHCNEVSFSLAHERGNILNSGRPRTSMSQKGPDLSLSDPLTSDHHLQVVAGNQSQTMENHSSVGWFPNQKTLAPAAQSEKLRHRFFSGPCSIRDVETVRICTTVESMHELSRGHPKFSQKTHHFLIAEKNDNLSEGAQLFKESKTSRRYKGNVLSAFKLSSDFEIPSQEGVKFQTGERTTDNVGKEKFRFVKTPSVLIENESSTETDTMDMAALQKNHISGLDLSPTNKGGESKPSVTREDVGGRLLSSDMPDINQEVLAPRPAASSLSDRETSSSRTQSLDAKILLSHAEKPTNSKSAASSDGCMGPEANSRWVKRLKLGDSEAHGTKNSNLGETSHDKVNKFLRKFINDGITGSENMVGKCTGNEKLALEKNSMASPKGESPSYSEAGAKSGDTALSHSWIRRWCHNRVASPQTKCEAEVLCDPQSSKATFDKLEKKQFPSIAAMALMGKAMNVFRPCEFRKRGSFVVWNT